MSNKGLIKKLDKLIVDTKKAIDNSQQHGIIIDVSSKKEYKVFETTGKRQVISINYHLYEIQF